MTTPNCANIGLGTPQISPPSKLDISSETTGRVCLSLQYTDPGRILNLCRSLFEKNSILIQKKINKYLMTVIPCCTVFQIVRFSRVNLYKITIIGTKTLQQEIHINHGTPLYQKLKRGQKEVELLISDMQPDLVMELRQVIIASPAVHIVAYPILHPASGKHLSYVVLVNFEEIIDYRRINYGLVNECMRYCIGILVNAVSYDEERIGHDRARKFIDKLKNVLVNIDNSSKLIQEIKKSLEELTDAESSNVIFSNHIGELTTSIFICGEQITQATNPTLLNQGIMNQVIKTGKLLNCSDHFDERCKTAFTEGVRNQISCPLKDGSRIIGVIEVYNKQSWHCFTEADEESVRTMAVILSPILSHSLEFTRVFKLNERFIHVNKQFLGDVPSQYEVDEVEHCTIVHDFPKYNGFQFSQLEMENYHVACMIVEIFHQFGLLTKFKIEQADFIRFVLFMQKLQSTHSYHNWTQSFGVLHFMTNIINSLNLVKDRFLSCMESFCLLLCAMSTSLNHCGTTTSFQVTAGTSLGSLFSSPDSLQSKHTMSHMLRIAAMPGCRIWENLSQDEFSLLIGLLSSLMNVTNLSSDEASYQQMAAPLQDFKKADPNCRLALMKLLLQCSYLADFTKNFQHLRLVGECLFFEFFRQGDLSNVGQVFDLSQFEPSPSTIPALQIEFIEKVCIPPFRLLSSLFPNMLDCTLRLEENLATWHKYKDHLLIGQMEEEQEEEQ